MRRNLDVGQGLVMSEAVMLGVAHVLGQMSAHEVVYYTAMKAFEEGRSLKEVLLETQEVTQHISEAEIDRLLDPTNYLGIAPRFVDKVLYASRRASAGSE